MNWIERHIKIMLYGSASVIFVGLYLFYKGNSPGGTVGLIIGAVMITASILLRCGFESNRKKLMVEGFCVDADFETVNESMFGSRNAKYLYNERHYVIKCSWCDPSGTGHIYTDRILLHFDPSFELSQRKIIKVYIDRNDPSNYCMDLEFLKELDKRRK